MRPRWLVLCSLFALFVSCYPNTRWWDDQVAADAADERESGRASSRGRPAAGAPAAGAPASSSAPELTATGVQAGIASFMADEINGRMTANGELYDMRQLTAAHLTLPFGSLVEVVNLATQKSVQVRINDRGPYVAGRIIDLSFQAAKELGVIDRGSARVELRVIRLGP